jgi:hypothetical protein
MSNEMAPVDLPADGPLDAFLEAVSESLTDGYGELGGLVPLCFVVKADGESYIIGVPFTGHDSDDADEHIAAWMRQHFKEREVIRYAYAVEASYSSHGRDSEFVSIEAADFSGAVCGVRKIIRPKNGKPYLGPLKTITSLGFFHGTLLPERGRLH